MDYKLHLEVAVEAWCQTLHQIECLFWARLLSIGPWCSWPVVAYQLLWHKPNTKMNDMAHMQRSFTGIPCTACRAMAHSLYYVTLGMAFWHFALCTTKEILQQSIQVSSDITFKQDQTHIEIMRQAIQVSISQIVIASRHSSWCPRQFFLLNSKPKCPSGWKPKLSSSSWQKLSPRSPKF